MDLDMYAHPTTKRNLVSIESDGVTVIPAESGELASGLEGEGRMAEPETIAEFLQSYFDARQGAFSNKRVLITAGPTYEGIDPVRFIGNRSSGKMGYALAEEMARNGAEVILISGPTKLSIDHPLIDVFKVQTAEEMKVAVEQFWSNVDIGIFAAAVSDYRPANQADQKIKKNDDQMTIELVKNPDILKWAGENKKEEQLLIGFALETNDVVENARKKLEKKNLDLIVMNTLEDKGAGFETDTNKITILDKNNNLHPFELKSKKEVARDIVALLKKIYK